MLTNLSISLTNQVVDDGTESLTAMGFETLQEFEEITNSPENVNIPHF